MRYINYKILTSKNLTLHELGVLQLIKQSRIEPLSEVIEFEVKETDIIEKFSNLGYIEWIKGKKGQPEFELIRATKKGSNVLEDIMTPDVLEEHLKMRDYLISIYLNHEDRERVVGNKELIAIYISVLQAHLGIDIYRFYYLCEFFLSEHIFTKKLENIFMDRNKIRYGDFKNHISDASIFQFYEQREEEVKEYWAKKIPK